MDRCETVAYDHLMFRGFKDVVYEPDGNVSPDFLVNGQIAVEVRRLNENERDLPTPKGLEEVEIPLFMRLRSLFKSYGPAAAASWWVGLSFERPVPPWATLEVQARPFLDGVMNNPATPRTTCNLGGNVKLEIVPRHGTECDTFALATISDGDSGGWVFEELQRNLRICIRDKSDKVAPFRAKYALWWLVFVDQVAYGLSEYDRAEFKKNTIIEHDWDKVILVNPLDHTNYFEL